MRRLLLVKHAPPQVDPAVESSQWALSEQGRRLCPPLAERLRKFAPSIIIASEEPKARETSELIADALALPVKTAPNLHEHDRRNVPHMRSSEFISNMEFFFRRPDELVLGEETAVLAEKRFSTAIADLLRQHPEGTVTVVSHGTVIALFVAAHGGGKAFDLWRRMRLPSFAVLAVPGFEVEEVIERVGTEISEA